MIEFPTQRKEKQPYICPVSVWCMQGETVHLERELHKAELAFQYPSSLRNMGKENRNFSCKKKNKRSVKSVLSSISMENKKDVSHRIPMIMTLLEGQQPPVRSKNEIYPVNDNKKVWSACGMRQLRLQRRIHKVKVLSLHLHVHLLKTKTETLPLRSCKYY